MSTETNPREQKPLKPKVIYRSRVSEAVYGLGLIGALIYYIGHATTFWIGVLGFFKAIVWPAMLVFEAMKYLNM